MPFRSSTVPLALQLLVVGLSTLLISCGPSLKPVRLPPAMTFTDLATGQMFETQNLKGNLVLLNLWAAWSPASAKELPELVDLNEKFSPKGLITLGVCLDDAPPAGLLVFAERHGIHYPLVRPGDQTLDQLNPIETIPYTILFDSQGKILRRFRGPFKPSEVREAIEKNL
ncbi:MAG: TlpA family protein disulfide reductase [Verrucomicrobia bacterium]|nr:TlpA family protein disulfide reductase [Verrucomicrobiota bacterium]